MGLRIGNNFIGIDNIDYKILLLIKYRNKGIIIKQEIIFYNRILNLKKAENIILIFIGVFNFGQIYININSGGIYSQKGIKNNFFNKILNNIIYIANLKAN